MMNLIGNVLFLENPFNDHIHDRFAKAFATTWGRIPAKERKATYNYLKAKKKPGRVCLCFIMDYQFRDKEPYGRFCWNDINQTVLFTFSAAVVEGITPDEALHCLIAHELGHCCRKAMSTWTPIEEDEERDVRLLTKSWGFEDPTHGNETSYNAFVDEVEKWRTEYKIVYGPYKESLIIEKFNASTI